jgi:hypothetical protein
MRRLLLPALFAAAVLPAQARPGSAPVKPAAPRATLSGQVYDSLAGKMLKGATVMVSASSVSAMTDSTGTYQLDIDSVGEGRHVVSFFHPSLDSIGIAPPPRTVVLHAGKSDVLDLAVPSATTIVNAYCRDRSGNESRTLIMGDVRDAEADKPLAGAFVVVQWKAMIVGNSTISTLPQALNVRADSNGFFRMCGVPAEMPLRAQARLSGKASGFIDLVVQRGGLVIQQFLVGVRPPPPEASLTATGAVAAPAPTGPLGTSTVAGTVVGGDGAPLEGAQVYLVGTTRSAKADYKGSFRLGGLPAGTQTIEVRLLSYQPRRYTVNLAPQKEAHLSAVLDQRAQVLDPVITVAKESSGIPGFDERAKSGQGRFFTRSQIVDANSNAITDLFRQVAGMQVLSVNGQYLVVSTRASATCKSAQWYVDGSPYDPGDENIDEMFRPTEVQAIEVYNSATTTPIEYQGQHSACGTILIWTNRGKNMKPKPAPPPGN